MSDDVDQVVATDVGSDVLLFASDNSQAWIQSTVAVDDVLEDVDATAE